ncbi:putative HKD family nuclease [Pseudomonas protegens]|uniref:phospholipase D-like domain-containing protein n=1 Tax=Pseudomonas protegens TaxID=380021 RepID=UPI00098D2E98|nr:phospholipase D family protein [Pseudomonas protegens]AQT07554.1 putative HKD family nuclease [Pseudomonas protegens]GED75551.1 hypothetical protein PFL02_24010 [Pseudomonas fluorescens]
MELMNQPFTGHLGNRLIEFLDSSDYHTLNIVVAFAKSSGVLRLKDSLEKFRKRGGTVNVYVGVDLGGTSYEALSALLNHTDSLNVVHSEQGQTFHTKIYQFLGKNKGVVVVGSHNLTGGGLWSNFESSVIIPVDNSASSNNPVVNGVGEYVGKLQSLKDSRMSITAQGDIDKLLDNGYVFKEVVEQARLARSDAAPGAQARMFGDGIPVKLPRIQKPEDKKALAAPPVAVENTAALSAGEDHTIWFETRSMTGGSANILDLSKKSLVERGNLEGTPYDLGDSRYMRGAVEFFGQNPAATNETKSITLNFEGIDYSGNMIIYPVGDNKNGTWRLQIRGTNSEEVKITDVFREKGGKDYLKHKVVAFARIKDDYYCMSVLPGSELENVKTASRILARNGDSLKARQIGIL